MSKRKEPKSKRARAVGYCRVSTTQQDVDRQRLEIHEYCQKHDLKLAEVIECKASTSRKHKERGIHDLEKYVNEHPTRIIVVSEVSRLGRSISDIFGLVELFVKEYCCRIVFIKENITLDGIREMDMQSEVMLGFFSLMAQVEKRLIRERTVSALAARKAAGVILGRPQGKSKLDEHADQIREWLDFGVTQKAIARRIHCTEATLSNWIKRQGKAWRNVPTKQ